MEYKYVVVWDDGFPSTFYPSIIEAKGAIEKIIEMSGISGKIITIKEYLGN